ncbi:MAG TPA: LysM peptidoglycan-binding domain-containing protein [Opitutaceae bacterium]|nr:LysM peptidoglycan-binding domain-containing protein [Opitutaceae bacterium]
MSTSCIRSGFAALSLLAFSGCTLVHFGRLPENPAALAQDNTRLQAENGRLQQELALSQKQGTTLRALLENGPEAPAASRQLVAELNETTRQLAALRADYARLKAEQDRQAAGTPPAAAPGAPAADNGDQPDLKTQLSDTENKLAAALRTYTQLEQENTQLHTEVDKVRDENSKLATQVKDVTAQNQAAQAALAQLNTELLAQKEAGTRSQQEAEGLRTQLSSANERIASLSAARASAAGSAQTISPGANIAADTGATEPAARFETSAARARARAAGDNTADTADLVSELSRLRARVQSLENERSSLQHLLAATTSGTPAAGSGGVAPTDVEANLATALRSYSVVQAENDQLKAENEKAAAEKAAIEAQLAATKSAVPLAAQANALREQLRQTQAQAMAIAAENADLKTKLSLGGPVAVAQPSRIAPTAPPTNPQSATQNPQSSARTHTIAAGDTLAKISRQYYGTPDRWNDILAANRDILRDEKSLVIGRVIRIP